MKKKQKNKAVYTVLSILGCLSLAVLIWLFAKV